MARKATPLHNDKIPNMGPFRVAAATAELKGQILGGSRRSRQPDRVVSASGQAEKQETGSRAPGGIDFLLAAGTATTVVVPDLFELGSERGPVVPIRLFALDLLLGQRQLERGSVPGHRGLK